MSGEKLEVSMATVQHQADIIEMQKGIIETLTTDNELLSKQRTDYSNRMVKAEKEIEVLKPKIAKLKQELLASRLHASRLGGYIDRVETTDPKVPPAMIAIPENKVNVERPVGYTNNATWLDYNPTTLLD